MEPPPGAAGSPAETGAAVSDSDDSDAGAAAAAPGTTTAAVASAVLFQPPEVQLPGSFRISLLQPDGTVLEGMTKSQVLPRIMAGELDCAVTGVCNYITGVITVRQ